MGLNISLSGLKAAQVGLDVTSHNIANVQTPNYQRQLVSLKTMSYNSGSPHIPSGSGVAIGNIYNASNPILNSQYSKSLSNSSEYKTLSNSVNSIQKILDNPELNLSKAMQNTYNAFQDLANNPTSLSARQTALESAQAFIDKSAALMKELSSTKYSVTDNYKNSADSINSLVKSLATVNEHINQTGNNPNPNLSAQKETLILDLSKLSGIEVSNNGKTIITTSGKLLLTESSVHEINDKDIPNINGGSIGAKNKIISNVLNPILDQLPKLAEQLAEEINKQLNEGYDLNGNPGKEIFNISSNNNPNLSLNINDPRDLAAASFSNAVADGSNAQKISDLRNTLFNGQTFQQQYSNLVSSIDNNAQKYKEMETAYTNISDNIYSEIQSVSGVNLDEEAVNLIKYQHLYQANAKALKVQEELFGTLINTIS